MHLDNPSANKCLLAHPFYSEKIRARRHRPTRSPVEVDERGCFIWQGSLNSKGYGFRRDELVHRAAWAALRGPIPPGYEIHHVCGEKRCANIDHLQCVSAREHRMLGRRSQKLNPTKVREILMQVVAGKPRRLIAEQFGITRHYVTQIKNGRAWSEVVRDFWREQGAWPVRSSVRVDEAA